MEDQTKGEEVTIDEDIYWNIDGTLFKECVACDGNGLLDCSCQTCSGCEACDNSTLLSCPGCQGDGVIEVVA